MNTEAPVDTKEVHTFEEYTLYSLDRTAPELLRMMERGKRIARHWPEVGSLVDAAGLCQEVASLACFQNSLSEALGDVDGEVGEQWAMTRQGMHDVMGAFEDALNAGDPDQARQLFAVDLPETLNRFSDVIPGLRTHIRETFMCPAEKPDDGGSESEDAG